VGAVVVLPPPPQPASPNAAMEMAIADTMNNDKNLFVFIFPSCFFVCFLLLACEAFTYARDRK
jgi:hypothetical protein